MIYLLLVLFQLKHFLADYPLQTTYMLGKFKDGYSWVLPLATHCSVHLLFTIIISGLFTGSLTFAVIMGCMDFLIHFTMNRIKASPNLLGRYVALTKDGYNTATDRQKLYNKYFWWSLGLDQMVHHLTDILIIYFIMGKL